MTNAPPTPDQIARVRSNLKNLQALNDYVYNQGASSRVLNAYFLLSEPAPADLGMTVGLNVIDAVLWAYAAELGPIGSAAASFLSGMLAYWATDPPSALNRTFANLVLRLQSTSLAVDAQLAVYYQDVVAEWNTSFTYDSQTQTLGSLAGIVFPAETDPQFEVLAAAGILALDQQVWKTALQSTCYVWSWPQTLDRAPGNEVHPPLDWARTAVYGPNPSYYVTWTWTNGGSGCGNGAGWAVAFYYLGLASSQTMDALNADCCNYLFRDSTPDTIINPNGLFTREEVFTQMEITVSRHPPQGGPSLAAESLSTAYLRAMATGKTLGALIAREGRATIERRVIDKAHQDTVFALNLRSDPRRTLEGFLDVKIPDVVSVNVIVEDARNFGLVIPVPGGPPPNASGSPGG